jgi:hypothetical protein
VKGKSISKQDEIIVSRNEWLQGFNFGKRFYLAYVIVDGERGSEPAYVQDPFHNRPDDTDTQKSLSISALAKLAKKAHEV